MSDGQPQHWIGGTGITVADLRAAIDGLPDDERVWLSTAYSGRSDDRVQVEVTSIGRDAVMYGYRFEGPTIAIAIATPCEHCGFDPCRCDDE